AVAALFVLLELGRGTFYLLLVSLGMVASGTAAYAGLSLIWQIASGLFVSLVGLVVLHRFRRAKGYVPTQSNANVVQDVGQHVMVDRKSTRLNSSHVKISYAVFCLKKKTVEQSSGRPLRAHTEQ